MSSSRERQVAEVVFVSAAPLDPAFPGGFAARHASFVAAVAQRHPVRLVYLHDGDDLPFRNAARPADIPVEIVDGSKVRGRDDIRLPRQAVARRVRSPCCGPRSLLVPLTANVAHVALGVGNAVAVLEEGWERLPFGRSRLVSERAATLVERLRCRSLYRRTGRCVSNIIVITPTEQSHFSNFVPPNSITVVPYGVDAKYFAPLEVDAQDIDVLVVGAVNRSEQRVEEMIWHLQNDPMTRSARCVIVGGAPRESIMKLASSSVEIAGYASDLRPYYARAKVVAVPTVAAIGIKTTMLQAWAMERPVVTIRAVLAATEHGTFQSALGVNSVPDMPCAIAGLLANPHEGQRLGVLARKVVLRHHEQVASAEMFASIVDRAVRQS